MATAKSAETSDSDISTRKNYPLLDVIEKRWSPRAFENRPVESWKLCRVLEAARWAPSCYNEQPWRLIVGDKHNTPETYDMIYDVLVPGNQTWAKSAPILMLTVAKLNFTHNGKPNRHAHHDIGLCAENMVLQAMALDLYSHQMAGIDPDKAMNLFGIPRGEYEVLTAIAIGYPGSPESLPEDLRKRELEPGTRKPLQEIVFSRHWQNAYPVCFS